MNHRVAELERQLRDPNLTNSLFVAEWRGTGASFSLPHLPVKVSSLNAERRLSLGSFFVPAQRCLGISLVDVGWQAYGTIIYLSFVTLTLFD